jgi:multiple antibiotic resistance protein
MDYSFLWLAFVALFALVDPIAGAIFYLSITKDNSEKERRWMAAKSAIFSAFILFFFILTGTVIFDLFSVTIEAFMIAGGLIVARSGFNMLSSIPRANEEEKKESMIKEDVSIIPMAIPILSGPGAITAAILWAGKAPSFPDMIGLFVVVIVVCALVYLILANAGFFYRVLGKTGTNVIGKIMGLITLVLGVQFIVDACTRIFLGTG